MGEPARATAQYDDVRGTIAIDGHRGLSIRELYTSAQIPKGYYPVGLEIFAHSLEGDKAQTTEKNTSAHVLCVDAEQAGKGPDEIQKYCRENAELPVFRFPATIDFDRMLCELKRVDVVLLSRMTGDAKVVVQPDR